MLSDYFDVDESDIVSLGERYNVAPSQPVYTVVEQDGSRRLSSARWGFVPPWADDTTGLTPINARVETVASSRMFRKSFAGRRCLVPADGYYEWQPQTQSGEDQRPRKQPWYIRPASDGILAFAGIWTIWRDPAVDGREVTSCAILTTEAVDTIAPIHHRMPVMLPESSWSEWLASGTSIERLGDLTIGGADPQVHAYQVTTRVNSPRNDGALLIATA